MTPPAGTVWIDPQNRVWVDNTALTTFSKCSLEAMIRYGWGYQAVGEVSAPLKSGSAGHAALEVYFATWDKDKALAKLRDEYQAWADEHVPDGDRLCYVNMENVVSAWIDAHPPDQLPFHIRPDLIEVPFAVALSSDVVLFGRIDFIGQSGDDRQWYIVDNKFTGRMDAPWLAKFNTSSQFSGYIYAAKKATDRNVVGAFVNAIEISRGINPEGTRKCQTHKVMPSECYRQHLYRYQLAITRREDDQIEEWRKTAVMKARQFRDLLQRFPTIDDAQKLRRHGEFTDQCVQCGVREWCQSGRQARTVPTMLKHAPWHPWKFWEAEVTA